MQMLSVISLEEDPYKNTLFDDPVHVSSFYTKDSKEILIEKLQDKETYEDLKKLNDLVYIGSLQLKMNTLDYSTYMKIIDNYVNGLYKEDYIHDFYTLKQGNEKGIRWHEIIGDSFIQSEFLMTELWYCDSIENRIIGYFVMNSTLPKLGYFKRIENVYECDECDFDIKPKQKLRYLLLFNKIGKEEFQNRYDISIQQLENWSKEPIGNYLEYIKENG